jgi:membrane associated rhomboid family serine protease
MQSFYMRGGSVYILGGRFPSLVFWLGVALIGCPALGAVLQRNGVAPILSWAQFTPDLVLRGQLWRLFTWQFFELNLLTLVFGVMIVLMLGRDLHYHWGPRRFMAIVLLVPAAAAGLTTLLALTGWVSLRMAGYLTITALLDVLVIAWAMLFPARQILVYFVLPVAGRSLVYITIGINVLVALLYGLELMVPHFFAIGIILLYLRGLSLPRFSGMFKRQGGSGPRRPTHLRPVERGERKEWLH